MYFFFESRSINCRSFSFGWSVGGRDGCGGFLSLNCQKASSKNKSSIQWGASFCEDGMQTTQAQLKSKKQPHLRPFKNLIQAKGEKGGKGENIKIKKYS